MSLSPKTTAAFLTAAALIAQPGCGAFETVPPPAPTSSIVSGVTPALEPVEGESQALQKHGEVSISALAIRYSPVKEDRYTFRRLQNTAVFQSTNANGEVNSVKIGATIEDREVVKPYVLGFDLTVNNQMLRVLRGSGVVPQVSINGRPANIGPAFVSELQNLMLPPRGDRTITIYGPPWADLKPGDLVGLSLFDVPVTIGEDGGVDLKENFEWVFEYRPQTRDFESTVYKTDFYGTPSDYAFLVETNDKLKAQREEERRGLTPPTTEEFDSKALERLRGTFVNLR